MSTLVLESGLDTGFSDSDRRTTERKPDFSFESEEGLRVFITKSIEVDQQYAGNNKVYTFNEDQFGTMGAGSYAILDTGSEYLLEKVILDDSINTKLNSYKVTIQEDDTITIAKDNAGMVNFLHNQKENSYIIEKTSVDGTDKIAPFLVGQDATDTSVGTYTPEGSSAIKVYQLSNEQLSSLHGEGFYTIETTESNYLLKEVEPNEETEDISNDYKLKPNDTSIGTYTVNPNSNLEEGVDYTVANEGRNYAVSFITEFPDETQGFYHVAVEDDAGNRNIVPDTSTEQSIWVDNVPPLLKSATIDETGRFIKLAFSEELDTDPDVSDYSINLTSGNGLTNVIHLTDAQIQRNNELKSDITIALEFPIFKGDSYTLDFVTDGLTNYKDTVGKVIIDPSPVNVINDSIILRSEGVVADGYLSNAKVFHDLNKNGIFDSDQKEVSVQSGSNGVFKGLHGDVDTPLVSIGGLDISTGLDFSYKSVDGSVSGITLYAGSDATVINALTSIVFQMVKVSKENIDEDALDLIYNTENSQFSIELNSEILDLSTYEAELVFIKNGESISKVTIDKSILSETEINDLIEDITASLGLPNDEGIDGVKVVAIQQDLDSDETLDINDLDTSEITENLPNTIIETQTFSSLDEAKSTPPTSKVIETEQAIKKLTESFVGLSDLSNVYHYDPIALNNVQVQGVSSQFGNLFVSLPYLLDDLSDSNEVIKKIAHHLLSRSEGDEKLDLSVQQDLETIFGVDNSPPSNDDDAPDLLKDLAAANKKISDSVTIEGQVFGQLLGQDEITANRVARELSLLEPDFQSTDDAEKFFGSADDDIIFAGAGDDLFGGGTDETALNVGDIFIGGEGKDAVFLSGQESDYKFFSETTGTELYQIIELSLDQGDLGSSRLLVAQKESDTSGYIYIQSEIVRFTGDSSWLSFDEVSGSLTGSISSDHMKGTSFTKDMINGDWGNDILEGFGGLGHTYDVVDGGGGDDTIIASGNNTEAIGGEGKDVFKVLDLSGTLLIKDFVSEDDKIDFRAFEKSEGVALNFNDIISSSTAYTEGEVSGVKIDISSWIKENISHSGQVIIEGATINNDGAIELADGSLLISENFFIETLTE
ncbi:MAG: hypothetical protein ACJ0DD_10465 [Paracoccaceae bacterium]